ncbi:MAG: amino acid ABC transporter ATP-binding protein [Clostridia bacterium]|nr:amino acid ABC transporter ATP-binding protein [Clostridia bacterium]
MIVVKNLSKSFGTHPVLENLSFSVSPGERVLISAPSGGGKTTLLRILCGLESADSGTVQGILPGSVAYQFQEPRLFPQLTALENITCIHPDPESARQTALLWLEKLGLAEAAHQYPHELSGGMKQRVALARALSADRPILFLDEPFTALDPELKDAVRNTVLAACEGKTLFLVSHDPKDGELLTERTISL